MSEREGGGGKERRERERGRNNFAKRVQQYVLVSSLASKLARTEPPAIKMLDQSRSAGNSK